MLGLVQSAWGGTEITSWVKNSSISNCKNASGNGPDKTSGGGEHQLLLSLLLVLPLMFVLILSLQAGLWLALCGTGWSRPLSTRPFSVPCGIRCAAATTTADVDVGATATDAEPPLQGENNVHDCVHAGAHGGSGVVGNTGIDGCGNVLAKTGYACSTKNLVSSWRAQWSAQKDTTSSMFPFGIVSLAAGTSEGHSQNMGNFRHAQTASYGFLPGPAGSGMEKTFIAQGYDAADPGDRESFFGKRNGNDGKFQGGFSGAMSQESNPYQVLLLLLPSAVVLPLPLCYADLARSTVAGLLRRSFPRPPGLVGARPAALHPAVYGRVAPAREADDRAAARARRLGRRVRP